MNALRFKLIASVLALCAAASLPSRAQDPERLSEEQMREFLLKANVVKYRQVGKGVTGISRLTLNDGQITHDAAFQSIDEEKPKMQLSGGGSELNFRDSYKFNIAAFELAKMLGLGDMMPVTVERKWRGDVGALSWWLPSKFDEEQREKENLKPPQYLAWTRQLNKMYVFAALVYDTDRNKGNVLYSEDWHVWMIDFTRAFRLHPDLQYLKILDQCDRQLWEKLRSLTAEEVTEKNKTWLKKDEIKALMARRDKLVAHFEKLIAEKGERAVIYN
jgi:hypothetical protein